MREVLLHLNCYCYLPYAYNNGSYLVGEIYKRPVIIYNYPKKIKPFYTRVNDDGKTVAAFDVVVPKVRVKFFLNLSLFLQTSNFIRTACNDSPLFVGWHADQR